MRSRFHHVRVVLSLFCYLAHHSNEAIKRFLRLVFRRLNHKTLMEEQREVNRRCMIAVVQQTFGDIHRGNARTLIFQTVEYELMTTQTVDGQFVDIF